ncbi:hypothetical protein F5Y13DRAFT_200361 [Hypoxylon sp. FL1857]|nr:hypothetical protein F5Y13DRAFT_200361 [Hypoxylon sp. FL1857]
MGNQPSTEVKAESDGLEGDLKSSPPHSSYPRLHPEQSSPSSPPNQPDIVFSSQVTSTIRRPPPYSRLEQPVDPITTEGYLNTRRDLFKSASNDEIPNSSPVTPTFMASPTQNYKQEIPESPDYNQQMSSPAHRSAKARKRRSKNRPSLNSQANTNNVNGLSNNDVGMNGASTEREGLSQRERKRRKGSEDGRQKEESPEASDMGNAQVVRDPAEAAGAQQDPLLSSHPTNGAISESTPSDGLPSRKRKTADSGSRRKKKKQKNIHSDDSVAENTTSFSGLAESLYAGRKIAEIPGSSANGSTSRSVKEKSPSEFDEEPESHDSSAASSNANDTNADSEQAANASAASDDKMDVDSSDSDPSDNVHSDSQDQMASDEDDQSDEKSKHTGESDDGGQNKSVGRDNSASSSGNATNNEYHPDEDEKLEDGLEHDHSPTKSRLKQGSARKRVVKRTFYDRAAEGNTNGTKDPASSSPIAGPSTVATKRQPKISAMLRGHAEDSPEPEASSSRHRNTPKTNTHPHELVKGQFSEFELRNITQAVERWRDDHNLTQAQVNDLIQGNPKEVRSHEFWSRVVATCPNRGRQKVINQCRRKFHNFVARGTWTPEQHEELSNMWEMHGNKFALIGKLINRHPEDVRDRIRNYVVCGEKRRVDPWTQEEEDRLQSIIIEALKVIREQRQKTGRRPQEPEEDLIDWQRVSELMGRTRSRLQCIQKWKLLSRQLANRGSIDGGEVLPVDQIIQNARDEATAMSSRQRYSVVKAIRACDVNADSRIPWAKVRTRQLGDQWSRPTLMVVWHRLKHSIPDWNIMSTPEIIHQLSKKYHETHQLDFPSGDDYDLDAEYTEIERKINKILKVNNRSPKSPAIVVKTDDDEEEEETTEDKEVSEDEGDDEDGESGAKSKDDEEESDEDSESNESDKKDETNKVKQRDHQRRDKNKKEVEDIDSASDESEGEGGSTEDGSDDESSHSVDLGNNNADNESTHRESSVDAPSISDFKPRKTPRSTRRYRQPRVIKSTASKHRSARMVIDESSQEEQAQGVEDDMSSDTNASEVESIPARL